MINRTGWVRAIRTHAIANYEKGGWDYLVECWDDDEIMEEISGCKTLAGAIKKVGSILKVMDEHRREVCSTGEW
jgi:hypothetical protein